MSLKLVILLQLCSIVAWARIRTCPDDGTLLKDNDEWCTFIVRTPAPFKLAEENCKQNGGHLAKIINEDDNLLLKRCANVYIHSRSFFWTGGQYAQIKSEADSCMIWTWRDNSLITNFFWNQDDNGNTTDESCISVEAGDGEWNRQNCSTSLPYACQKPSQIGACESGWTLFDPSVQCYKAFARNYTTAVDAEKECVGFGGHLASIYNEEENAMLVELLTTLAIGNWSEVGVWIGGVSDGNNTWSWTDGTPFVFKNWRPTDPNVVTGKAYTIFFPDEQYYNGIRGTWDDAVASKTVKRFVCQKMVPYL